MCLEIFFVVFPLFLSNLIVLCLEYTLCMISIILNVSKFVLWLRIWPISVCVLWVLKKNVFSDIVEWNVLYLLESVLMMVLSFILLLSCLVPSIVERGMLKTTTVIVDLSISSFSSSSFGFRYLAALPFGEYTFRIIVAFC